MTRNTSLPPLAAANNGLAGDVVSGLPLLRLLHLSSAALPVGAYAFSQGLEYAVDQGWLRKREQVGQWIADVMQHSLQTTDIPLLLRQVETVATNDAVAFDCWDATALACRETAELRLTDTAIAEAMQRLLSKQNIPLPLLSAGGEHSFVSLYAIAACHWQIPATAACAGFLWSWLENQVAAATKLVPLGQTEAQQLLTELIETIPALLEAAQRIEDHEIGGALPGLAMASSWHETQYSRLFRS